MIVLMCKILVISLQSQHITFSYYIVWNRQKYTQPPKLESPSESKLVGCNSHGVIVLNVESELPHLGKEKVQIPVALSMKSKKAVEH